MPELRNSKTVVHYNPSAKSAEDFFGGRDLTDMNNEPCFYSTTMRGHKKAWARLVEVWTEETTMREAMDVLRAFKINTHSWCAMD